MTSPTAAVIERPTLPEAVQEVAAPVSQAVSPDTRSAAGKALRDKIAREDLGWWKAEKRRANPVDVLMKSDSERMPQLVPIRYGRMLQSPFAFYRGSAGVMAADLAKAPTTGLRVQACGDAHLANFGGFATPERNIIFDINDFDETLPAPWDWDIRRLVASVVLAGRSVGISEKAARDCAVSCARSYRAHMREFADMDPLELWYMQITAEDVINGAPEAHRKHLRKRVAKAAGKDSHELAYPQLASAVGGRIHITDQPPLIFHPEGSDAPEFRKVLEDTFQSYRTTLPDDRRALYDRYSFVDAAIKVVGIGSVGRRCWIVLVMSESNSPLFLQFKEAVASVLEPFAGVSAYPHHGQRVVMGQRLMQPASDIFLGWVTAPNGRQFYARQLRDAKIKPLIETFDAELLDAYAEGCGWVLARAHAKASELSATISGYLGTSSDEFDEAMGDFAVAYANQAERDHAALKAAVRRGKVRVELEQQ